MDDSKIVDLYLERNPDAIAETQKQYGRQLRGLGKRITEDVSAAEECENDTYLKTWESVPPHEPRSYFFAYLARIMRHLALDWCKFRGRDKRSAVVVELSAELEQCIAHPDDVENRVAEEELARALNGFLRELPVVQRQVFLRRYWYADSVRELARRFDYSESKVKSMLHRTRQQLRVYLEREGYQL